MSSPELEDLVERFLGAPQDQAGQPINALLKGLRQAGQAGDWDSVAAVLRRVTLPTLDYTSIQSLYRILTQGRKQNIRSPQQVRLAVLGSFTTHQLVPLIELHLFAMGIDAEIYEADYGVFRQEIFDPSSGLYEFRPNAVFLATSWRDLARRPNLNCDLAELSTVVEAELADWRALWQTLQDRLGCQVIQNNFVLPPWRSFSNHELRQPGSQHRYLSAMNQALVDLAPPFVTIHDVEGLAALRGRWNWDDPRFVHQAKLPCNPECLVDYGHSVATLVASPLGAIRKCLVLDLDNTLWGGVIGDDGLGGIRLGQGEPEGEAFLMFQQYVKSLKERGVILAVCSKNEEANAREAFEKHTEMVLRMSDISCFVANWQDKPSNLKTIASTLNIGLNSLVFVDDNPAERSIVRRLVPEVAVPELPIDPAGYIKALDEHRYFQVLSVAPEDFQRTDYYRGDAMRKSVEAAAGDMEEFLGSLEMVARVGPIDATTLERSAQLIQRSNQFNVTTVRRSAAELLPLMSDPAWITLTVSLADRFGDNGLISVLLASVSGEVVEIDTWLMSCRVLKRGVESFLLNCVCREAQLRRAKLIRGSYLPTAKNALVKDHYPTLGFRRVGGDDDVRTDWELDLAEGWQPHKTFITEKSTDGTVER